MTVIEGNVKSGMMVCDYVQRLTEVNVNSGMKVFVAAVQ